MNIDQTFGKPTNILPVSTLVLLTRRHLQLQSSNSLKTGRRCGGKVPGVVRVLVCEKWVLILPQVVFGRSLYASESCDLVLGTCPFFPEGPSRVRASLALHHVGQI